MTKLNWTWLLLSRQLWFRASLIGLLAVLAAILGLLAEQFLPWDKVVPVSPQSVDKILSVLTSSMLAVTTFSVSVMIAAYGSATSNVTPRATTLLMQDRTTLNVLSTFIGSFIFGVVGTIVLQTGYYGDKGRLVLFLTSIGVIAIIVVSLLRWIDHLTRFGRVGETTAKVEEAASGAMRDRLQHPYLDSHPYLSDAPPAHAEPVFPLQAQYIQYIDIPALQAFAAAHELQLVIAANPGTFLWPGRPLAWVYPPEKLPEGYADTVRTAYSLSDQRSYDQDPRFGLVVMSEIAARALSPAVNDAGTAIDVISRLTRTLALWGDAIGNEATNEIVHTNLHVPPLRSHDLFEDAFAVIARDGASMVEVHIRLRKALQSLARLGDADFQENARTFAAMALARAKAALSLDSDLHRLVQIELESSAKKITETK